LADLKLQHKYLAHIDILRAIAVLLVIFNHLNIIGFGGGYIGVDIFFVISGYLITKNIAQEIVSHEFSFLKFYQRRAVRLAPAFFAMLIFCSLVSALFFTSSELFEYFKSLIASTFLSANIYFWQSLSDYFSINAHSTPLLHIWSLSLEEQFYLLWPAVLICAMRIKKQHKLILFTVIFLSSFFYSYSTASLQPIFAYYMLPTRFFEFMLGGLLVYCPENHFNDRVRSIFAIISLVSIFVLSYTLNKNSIFPGLNALLICCASAVYIYMVRIDGENKKYKALLYLGKLSYPMYLFHWPLIVWLNINGIELDTNNRIIVVLATIMLSWLTYERIEKPARAYAKAQTKILKVFFVFPCLVALLVGIASMNYLRAKEKSLHHSEPLHIQCIDSKEHPIPECALGDLSAQNISVLLLGDSHANAQRGLIDVLAKDAQLKGYEITYSSTAFLANIQRFVVSNHGQKIDLVPSFKQINDKDIELIKQGHYQYVIFGGFFPHNAERNIYSVSKELPDANYSHQFFIKGLTDAIEIVLQSDATPIIINDNPQLRDVDVNCKLRIFVAKAKCFNDRKQHDQDFNDWTIDLKQLKEKYPQLIVLDFTSIVCSETKCYSYLDDVPLYRDQQHLTYTGSAEIGLQYLKKYGNPLKMHGQSSHE